MAFDPNDPYAQAVLQQGQAAGYNPMQIAALLGRTQVESGFNPSASGDNGTANGYQQWRGPRFQALQQYANAQGKTWTDPSVQAGFMFNELGGSEGKSGAALKAAQDPNAAQDAVSGYERPQGYSADDPSQSMGYGTALTAAQQIQQALTGQTPAVSGDSAALTEGRSATTNVDPTPTGSIGTPAAPQGQQASLGDNLLGVAAALSARDSPGAAQVFAQMAKNNTALAKAQAITDKGTTDNGKYRIQIDPQGNYKYIPVPQDAQPDPAAAKVAQPGWHDTAQFQDASKTLLGAQQNIDKATTLQEAVQSGTLNPVWDARIGAFIDNTTGHSTENSRNIKDLNALVNQYVINVASQEKGPMTKAKMDTARLSVLPSGAENDPVTIYSALDRMKQVQSANFDNSASTIGSKLDMFPQLGTQTQVNGQKVALPDFIKQKSQDWADRNDKLTQNYPGWVQKHDNPGGAPAAPVAVSNQDDYAKLPSGTQYIAPDGSTRTKK